MSTTAEESDDIRLAWAFDYDTVFLTLKRGACYPAAKEIPARKHMTLDWLKTNLPCAQIRLQAAKRMLRLHQGFHPDDQMQQSLMGVSEHSAVTDVLEETITNLLMRTNNLKPCWVGPHDVNSLLDEVQSSGGILRSIPMSLKEEYDNFVRPVEIASQDVWFGRRHVNSNHHNGKGARLFSHWGITTQEDGSTIYTLSCDMDMTEEKEGDFGRSWLYNSKIRLKTFWEDFLKEDQSAILGAVTANHFTNTANPFDGSPLPPIPNILLESMLWNLSAKDGLVFKLTKGQMQFEAEKYCGNGGGRRRGHPFQEKCHFRLPSVSSTQSSQPAQLHSTLTNSSN